MTPDTIERIEMKIAFLERANTELSDVVYRQQRELDQLRLRVEGLSSRLDTMKTTTTEYSAEDERPPHY